MFALQSLQNVSIVQQLMLLKDVPLAAVPVPAMSNSTMRVKESQLAQLQILRIRSSLWAHGPSHVTLTTTSIIPYGLLLPVSHTSQTMSCGMPACVMSLKE